MLREYLLIVVHSSTRGTLTVPSKLKQHIILFYAYIDDSFLSAAISFTCVWVVHDTGKDTGIEFEREKEITYDVALLVLHKSQKIE